MSLKKIAEIVGVSPSTVSRVLNDKGPGCASPEVREKIWAAATELNYTPDPRGRMLRSGKKPASENYKISIILGRFDTLEVDPFFRELFQCLRQELFAQNCVIQEILNGQDLKSKEILPADGFIILGRCKEDLLGQMKGVSDNLVRIGRNPTNFDLDEVFCSGMAAAAIAMKYLIEKGHKKIAYIGDCSYENRYVGYLENLIQHDLAIDHSLVYATNQTEQAGYEAAVKLLQEGRATAVFCANDNTALGFLRALKESGRKKSQPVPALVSIDNIEEAQTTEPPLTTVNIPREEMAHSAVRVLIDRIQKGHREHLRVEFPCRLVVR